MITYGLRIAKRLQYKLDNDYTKIVEEYENKISETLDIRTKIALKVQRIHKLRKLVKIYDQLDAEIFKWRKVKKL